MRPDQMDDSEAFRTALIEVVRAPAGGHPELDTLVDYHTDALDSKADDQVRDHLAACRECATAVLDLEPLVLPEAVPTGVADLGLETAWRDLRSRIRALENGSRLPGVSRWAAALAASLLVATVGLSVWVSQLRQTTADLRRRVAEFSKPQVNQPVFYVDELARSSGQDLIEIEVPPEASYFTLIFASAALGVHEEYQLVFANAEGEEILRASGLRESDSGGLRLGLSRNVLPAGDYLIRLQASDGSASQQLDEYRRRILY